MLYYFTEVSTEAVREKEHLTSWLSLKLILTSNRCKTPYIYIFKTLSKHQYICLVGVIALGENTHSRTGASDN